MSDYLFEFGGMRFYFSSDSYNANLVCPMMLDLQNDRCNSVLAHNC